MTTEQERQYEHITVRVSVRGEHTSMGIRTSGPEWDMRDDMAMDGIDGAAMIAWLYSQFDQTLAELRRLARRGQFCRGGDDGH